MIWILTAGATIVALVLAFACAALVEVFRQLAELRVALDLTDEPRPLGVRSGQLRTDEIGLPQELAAEPQAIVVLLSPKCITCLAIAEAFSDGSPSNIWFMLTGLQGSVESASSREIERLLVRSAGRVVIDHNDEIANRIGLHITPAVLQTSYGDVMRAYGVGSPRQVQKLLPSLLTGRPPRPLEPALGAASEGNA